jgi:hypothetical protein
MVNLQVTKVLIILTWVPQISWIRMFFFKIFPGEHLLCASEKSSGYSPSTHCQRNETQMSLSLATRIK